MPHDWYVLILTVVWQGHASRVLPLLAVMSFWVTALAEPDQMSVAFTRVSRQAESSCGYLYQQVIFCRSHLTLGVFVDLAFGAGCLDKAEHIDGWYYGM